MSHDAEIITLIARTPLFLPAFALVLSRISGLMIAAPVLGSEIIPVRIRALLAAAVALVLFPVLWDTVPVELTLKSVVVGMFGELLIGLFIGLSMSLLFAAVEVAGTVVGQQAGLGLGQVFNPVLNSETTALGELFVLVAMTAFVMIGGVEHLLRALLDTFQVIPVMSFRYGTPLLDLFAELLTAAYGVGLRLAAPVLITLLLASLVMGFLSRTIPQLNILSVGFAVQTLLALACVGFVLSGADGLLLDAVQDWFEWLRGGLGLET